MALVLRLTRKGAIIDLGDGIPVEAVVRGRLHRDGRRETSPVAAGDDVEIEETDGRPSIVSVGPRRSVLVRPEVHGRWKRQVLVANADLALLVFALRDPEPRQGLIDRLLVACHAGLVHPVLVWNKSDLAPVGEAARLVVLYESLGYETIRTAALRGDGVDALRRRVTGRRAALAGPSGTGKSSLLNAALPGVRLRTAAVRAGSGKGTHTTTSAELLPAPGGGHVADTPGVQEFGIVGIPPDSMDLHFPEFPGPGLCGFRDCRHRREPGCVVLDAVRTGSVDRGRHDSYLTFLAESEAEARRETDG